MGLKFLFRSPRRLLLLILERLRNLSSDEFPIYTRQIRAVSSIDLSHLYTSREVLTRLHDSLVSRRNIVSYSLFLDFNNKYYEILLDFDLFINTLQNKDNGLLNFNYLYFIVRFPFSDNLQEFNDIILIIANYLESDCVSMMSPDHFMNLIDASFVYFDFDNIYSDYMILKDSPILFSDLGLHMVIFRNNYISVISPIGESIILNEIINDKEDLILINSIHQKSLNTILSNIKNGQKQEKFNEKDA